VAVLTAFAVDRAAQLRPGDAVRLVRALADPVAGATTTPAKWPPAVPTDG
jgi:hypothetical protein